MQFGNSRMGAESRNHEVQSRSQFSVQTRSGGQSRVESHDRAANNFEQRISPFRRSGSADLKIVARTPIIKSEERDTALDEQIDRMKAAVKIYSVVVA